MFHFLKVCLCTVQSLFMYCTKYVCVLYKVTRFSELLWSAALLFSATTCVRFWRRCVTVTVITLCTVTSSHIVCCSRVRRTRHLSSSAGSVSRFDSVNLMERYPGVSRCLMDDNGFLSYLWINQGYSFSSFIVKTRVLYRSMRSTIKIVHQ